MVMLSFMMLSIIVAKVGHVALCGNVTVIVATETLLDSIGSIVELTRVYLVHQYHVGISDGVTLILLRKNYDFFATICSLVAFESFMSIELDGKL
jgi:hypothetical protein